MDSGPAAALRLIDAHLDADIHALIEFGLMKWAWTRILCTTETGRLGSVPTTTQEGDAICVLYGGQVPYVLRRRGLGDYTVVGECYMDGIMHTEDLDDESFEESGFRLV